MSVYRIYVEKKPEYAVEAKNLLSDIKTALRMDGLRNIRIMNRYDAEGLGEEDFASLPPELIAHFSDLFSVPEMLVSIDGQLTVLPC